MQVKLTFNYGDYLEQMQYKLVLLLYTMYSNGENKKTSLV